MPTRCKQELCTNWTGEGCACSVFGLEPGEFGSGAYEQFWREQAEGAEIYACIDAGHDVGQRHEDGYLLSATCHDCGKAYDRERSVAARAEDQT